MLIDSLYRPEVLKSGDARFEDMVRYMDWASDGFEHRFRVEGDEVVTTSGLLGKIAGLSEKVVTLEVAPNVRVKVVRSQVSQKIKNGQIEDAKT